MNRPLLLSSAMLMAGLTLPTAATAQNAGSITAGSPVMGEFSPTDPVDDYRGNPADTYIYAGEANSGIRVSLGSDIADTYLVVRDPYGNVVAYDDDGGGNLDSLVELRLSVSGEYRIVATTFGDANGPYVLELETIDASELPDPTRAVSTATAELGATVSGELATSDGIYRSRDTFVDAYKMTLSAGDEVEVHLTSDAFDTYLIALAPTGESLMQDDDGGNGTNSRVRFTAPIDGDYRLLATSFSSGSTGAYALRSQRGFTSITEGATALELGQRVEARLVNGVAAFSYEATAGEVLLFDAMSDEIDVYADALDYSEIVVASDDDSGEGTNARVRLTAYESGTFVFQVRSYTSDADGAIAVQLRHPNPVTVAPRALRIGRSVEGTLDATDAVGTDGYTRFDMYALELDPGDVVTLTATNTTEAGPYGEVGAPVLRVVSPIGEELYDFNAAYPSGGAAQRVIRAALGGTYLIGIASWAQDITYTVLVETGEAPALGWDDVATTPISVVDTVDGAHDENDATHPERMAKMDIYVLNLTEQASITIEMNSDLFDTYLEIRDENDWMLHSNDDYNGLNSRINVMLRAGTYRVVATQFSSAEGVYTLSVAEGAARAATVRPIAIGDTVPVDTAEASTLTEWGDTAVFYTFDASAGQELTIRLSADSLDALLMLTDELGDVVSRNDDADGSLNSRITLTIPRTGVYTIRAGDLGGNAGIMQLSLTEGLEGDVTTPYQDPYDYGGYGEFGGYDDGMYDGDLMFDDHGH